MKIVIVLALLVVACNVASGFTVAPVRNVFRTTQMTSMQHATTRLQPLKLKSSSAPEVQVSDEKNPFTKSGGLFTQAKILWDFTRPHTIIGSCISIVSVFMFAVPKNLWTTPVFRSSVLKSLIPSLFVNLYITGVNQVTDVEIDKINKPYLPIAAGRLSKRDGTLIVLASLFLGLFDYGTMDWPLRAGLASSALLGSLYSLPPFRLKRFPLLAALSILTVRGTLINLGFFLQAKSSVLSEKVSLPTSVPAALSLCKNLASKYPEALAVASFFTVFGAVIALMKDVPDIKGDTEHNIKSFSVRMGAEKMFGISWGALHRLLNTAAVTVLVWSQVLHPLLHTLAAAARDLPAAFTGTPLGAQLSRAVGAPLSYAASGVVSKVVSSVPATIISSLRADLSPVSQSVRVAVAMVLSLMADDVRSKALKVNTAQPDAVFKYYMYIWNIFYSCYFLLPLLRV